MSDDDVKDMSFEQAIAELERVVAQLDSGSVELDASIALYERGTKLKNHCDAKLKDAEEKVAKLTVNSDGQPTGTTPLDAG